MNLEDCINYLLTISQHKVFSKMKDALSAYEITPIQYGVLNCIYSLRLNTPKEIAEYLNLSNPTISGILDRMENKNLIYKNINPEDRRSIELKLTRESRKIIEEILVVVDNVNNEVLSIFTENEIKDFKRYLKRLNTI